MKYISVFQRTAKKKRERGRDKERGREEEEEENGGKEKKKRNLKGLEMKKKVFCAELNIILFPLKGLRKQRQS